MTPSPSPSGPRRVVPTREGYDRWAGHYDGEGNPLVALEEPHVDRLLEGVAGSRLLDVGCGTGRHALRLAKAGAQVTAVDFSSGMLAQARAKPGADSIRFVEHDLSRPLPFPSGTFERVVCGLVLDHIPDLGLLFREMRRVCSPVGLIVVSVMHPAMMLRDVQARFRDPTTDEEIRPESCPHQVSDYVMAALGAGLTLLDMAELSPDQALAARVPRAARYVGWPLLLTLKLTGVRR